MEHLHNGAHDSQAELRTACEQVGLPWWEDPSNASQVYHRNVVRAQLQHMPHAWSTATAATMATIQRNQALLDHLLLRATRRAVRVDVDLGAAHVQTSHPAFAALPAQLRARLFRQVLWLVSGHPYPPGTKHVERMHALAEAAPSRLGQTWAGEPAPDATAFERQYMQYFDVVSDGPAITDILRATPSINDHAAFELQYLSLGSALKHTAPPAAPQRAAPSGLHPGRRAKHNIAGCVVALDDDGMHVSRQPVLARQMPVEAVAPNSAVWWDGRFVVAVTGAAAGPLRVRALGRMDEHVRGAAQPGLMGVVPVVCGADSNAALAIPHLHYSTPQLRASATWLPRFSLDNDMAAFTESDGE